MSGIHRAAADRLDPELLRLSLILAAGGIAPALDTTVVNVALATLGRSLHATVPTLQWVTAGYLLALAMAIPLTGWAIERLGGKRLWLTSLGVFLFGSMLSGIAWNADALIVFRVLQGVGAGVLMPTLQTILARAAGPRRIGRAITVITYIAVVAPILGPLAGGLVLSHLGWRWIFYLNVPICVLGLYLAWRGLPADSGGRAAPLDAIGLTLLSPALAAAMYGLTQVGAQGRLGATAAWLPLAAGLLLLGAFIAHALRRGETALLDLGLFRERSFASATALLFLSGLALYGAMLLLPLYYQLVRGETALAAGLLLVPQGVGSLLTRWAGRLTDRIGPRPIVLGGMLAAALGTVAYAAAGPATSLWLLGLSLVVRGAGLGAANIAITAGAYQSLRAEVIPHASSAMRILQQMGGAFGTAVLAMILAAQPGFHGAFGALGRAMAFDAAFRWSLIFTAAGAALAFVLPRSGVKAQAGEVTAS